MCYHFLPAASAAADLCTTAQRLLHRARCAGPHASHYLGRASTPPGPWDTPCKHPRYRYGWQVGRCKCRSLHPQRTCPARGAKGSRELLWGLFQLGQLGLSPAAARHGCSAPWVGAQSHRSATVPTLQTPALQVGLLRGHWQVPSQLAAQGSLYVRFRDLPNPTGT